MLLFMLTLFEFWFISLVTYDHVFIQKNGQYIFRESEGYFGIFLKIRREKVAKIF